MKKLALILAIMLIPCTAFGLEMLDETAMDEITGQAGVNIAADDIQMFINIEKLAWIDCDGFNSWEGKGSCCGAPGAIVLNNFQIDVLNINAITTTDTEGTAGGGLDLMSTSCGGIPLFYNYATTDTGDGCYFTGQTTGTLGLNNYYGKLGDNSTFVPHFLTIDATDALPASTEGLKYWANHTWTSASPAAGSGDSDSTIGGVLIGIPTIEIYINDLTLTPMYDGDVAGFTSNALNDDSNITSIGGCGTITGPATFGTVAIQGLTFSTLSGWIEISPK